ncbi:MAG TPA: methyltransferase domain-containing protein, partial [Thermoleophilaceae bacterium]|nr:methyltransferase domain-containing protein [Thermoleophilaceae bacterium]
MEEHELREEVRRRYAEAARSSSGCGGGSGCGGEISPAGSETSFGASLYGERERNEAPLEASLGCGNPTAVAELHEGEVVLDLGSGAGGDVLLSARRVGPSGKAYGLDMTDEMLALAHRNAVRAGVGNLEFLKAEIEDIPLDDGSVDVVISNCEINLSGDKN